MDDEGKRAIAETIADVARAGFGVGGAALCGVGGYLHYPPLGFLIAGVMLFSIALIGGLRRR